MEIDPNCKYCETYFTSRNEFIRNKEAKIGEKAKDLFPLKILIVRLLNNLQKK